MFFKANYFLSTTSPCLSWNIMDVLLKGMLIFKRECQAQLFIWESEKKSSSFVLRVNCRKSTIDPLMRCHFLASNPLTGFKKLYKSVALTVALLFSLIVRVSHSREAFRPFPVTAQVPWILYVIVEGRFFNSERQNVISTLFTNNVRKFNFQENTKFSIWIFMLESHDFW